jgi:hypothetical protein
MPEISYSGNTFPSSSSVNLIRPSTKGFSGIWNLYINKYPDANLVDTGSSGLIYLLKNSSPVFEMMN